MHRPPGGEYDKEISSTRGRGSHLRYHVVQLGLGGDKNTRHKCANKHGHELQHLWSRDTLTSHQRIDSEIGRVALRSTFRRVVP